MTTDQTGKTLVYDAWNRLVDFKNGSTSLVRSSYDALGRRVTETRGTEVLDLYYSQEWQVLEERISGAVKSQYVWSPEYVDALILRDRDTDNNGSLEERLYVQQDPNWDVTALVSSTGTVVERYVYSPFGAVTVYNAAMTGPSTASPATNWLYLHQGGRRDGTSGLYHFRNRDYSPTLGRWTSVDPIGFAGGDNNLYRALGNNPVNYVDPYGLQKITTLTGDTWPPRRPEPGPTPTQGGSLLPRPVRDFGGQVLNPQTYVNICTNTATCIGNLGNQLVGIGGQAITSQTYINICDNTKNCYDNLQTTVGGQVLIGGGQIGATMFPLVGEAQDYAVLTDEDSAWWEKLLAGGSLGANVLTGGVLPNIGGVLGAGKKLRKAPKRPRRLPPKGTPERAVIEAARKRGIAAKQAEELANVRAGGKGSGVWTEEELKQIKKTGVFPEDAVWHHDPTVANRPDLAADPSVVQPIRGGTRGHFDAHEQNWQKPYPE